MMASSLKFNVDESVLFNQEEGIANILSVSLEPDIEVEDNGDYVTIKGSLRLDGEFEVANERNENEEHLDQTNEQLAYRSVQEVRKHDDNIAQFQHRFPVEITIPHDRVNKLDDIYVTVESFDYRLPNPSCLQMSAELEIGGIREEQMERTTSDPLENYDFEERVKEIYIKDKTSFVVDSKRDESVTMDVHNEDQSVSDEVEAQFEGEREEPSGPQIELKSREETSQPEEKEQNILTSTFESMSDNSKSEDRDKEVEEFEEDSAEVEEVEVEEEKSSRSENALYLTKMLTREGEQFSKLRMRIIQPGDSLDSIAEAYNVQPTQIARLNRLHDEQVEEGQILYIPIKAIEKH